MIENYKKYNRNLKLRFNTSLYFAIFLFMVLVVGLLTFFLLSLLSLTGQKYGSFYFQTFGICLIVSTSWMFYLATDYSKESKAVEKELTICFENESIKLDKNNEEIISIEISGNRDNIEHVKQTFKNCSDKDFTGSKSKFQNPWKNF